MTTNPAFLLFWKKIWAPQCQQRYRDTAPRGNGNRAARRAMQTRHAQKHAFWSDEPVYSPSRARADLFDRGFNLNLIHPTT